MNNTLHHSGGRQEPVQGPGAIGKLYRALLSAHNEGRTGKLLAQFGTVPNLRYVVMFIRNGEIVAISDAADGTGAADLWTLPVRSAVFLSSDAVPIHSGRQPMADTGTLLRHIEDIVNASRLVTPAGPSELRDTPEAAGQAQLSNQARGKPSQANRANSGRPRRNGLWELSQRLDRIIAKQHLNRADVRGKIALASGVFMEIDEYTPDDPNNVEKIKAAIRKVLGEPLFTEIQDGEANPTLWELSKTIDEVIRRKRLDPAKTRGAIGLKAGVLMDFDEYTADDGGRIAKIRAAAKEILGEVI